VISNAILDPLGAEFKEVDSKIKNSLGIKGGLQIIKLRDGKFKQGGIKEGYIITRIDKETINNLDDLKRVMDKVSGGVLIEGIYPNGTIAYYAVGM
jgi:S1-C subfamily serine protease